MDIITGLIAQFQSPTLAFLLGGMLLAAMGSRFDVPAPVYAFIVILLLLKIGIGAGMAIRTADLASLAVPAVMAAAVGVAIVGVGGWALTRVSVPADGWATVGLFGAVSASSLAAAMAMLDAQGIAYEGFIGALYPIMDVAALVTAIVLARLQTARTLVTNKGGAGVVAPAGQGVEDGLVKNILVDTLRSPAISALLVGLALGVLARPDAVFDSFYEPLFRGLLSILMLVMGMEAWSRIGDLRKVAHVYVIYGLTAPLAHGAIGFAAGLIAHHLTGFSAGGVVLLAVMAASSSDISGPPTMRAALPDANPSAYVGTSTGIGTPVAILSIPLWIALAQAVV